MSTQSAVGLQKCGNCSTNQRPENGSDFVERNSDWVRPLMSSPARFGANSISGLSANMRTLLDQLMLTTVIQRSRTKIIPGHWGPAMSAPGLSANSRELLNKSEASKQKRLGGGGGVPSWDRMPSLTSIRTVVCLQICENSSTNQMSTKSGTAEHDQNGSDLLIQIGFTCWF